VGSDHDAKQQKAGLVNWHKDSNDKLISSEPEKQEYKTTSPRQGSDLNDHTGYSAKKQEVNIDFENKANGIS